MIEPLTEQQKELVEQNHNLIYAFANSNNLLIDDFYDILAIGLCKASTIFNENKGTFSTVAYRCMLNELRLYWKNNKRKSVIPNILIVSYDVSANDVLSNPLWRNDLDNSLLDNFADEHMTHDIVIGNIVSTSFINTLNKKEKKVIKLLIDGYNQEETAAILNCKRQSVNNYVKIIRRKWLKYFENY